MQINLFLGIGALVIGDVNRARQFDEAFAEASVAFFVADVVLDFPQGLVDRLEFALKRTDLVIVVDGLVPDFFQHAEFGLDIGDLGGIGDTLGLDL